MIRSMLICALAMILLITLTACNNDLVGPQLKEEEEPDESKDEEDPNESGGIVLIQQGSQVRLT